MKKVVLTVTPAVTILPSLTADSRLLTNRYIARCRMCGRLESADSVALLEGLARAHASFKQHTIDIEDHGER